jgi:uncharacterized protein
MALLMCPNCNSSMQALNRSGVEFDMCPSCRGVWLDRGELEKIIENVRAEVSPAAPVAAPAPQFQQAPQPQQHRPAPQPQQYYGERGEHGERGEYGYGHKRKKRFDMFDIFD